MMVQRADIEAKAREIEQALTETRESMKNRLVLVALGVAVVVAVAFLLGRRKGRKGAAVVEVYKL